MIKIPVGYSLLVDTVHSSLYMQSFLKEKKDVGENFHAISKGNYQHSNIIKCLMQVIGYHETCIKRPLSAPVYI